MQPRTEPGAGDGRAGGSVEPGVPGIRRPEPVPEGGVGPVPAPGRADELVPGLVRLTAPNPGVMTGPGTNTYVVGTDDLAVVDPGPDDAGHRQAILDTVRARGGRVRWVLVTHSHADHAPGAVPLAREVGAEVIGYGPRAGLVPDRTAQDGWRLTAPSFCLRALHTPGHAGDHVCWLLEEPSVLLSGDHVMQGSTVVIRPPDGDMAAYLSSLRRVQHLHPPLAAVAPGHGRLITDPATVIEGIVAHRLGREAVVAAALAERGPATVDDLAAHVYADVDPSLLPVARFSLWAHLRKLADDGLAVARPGDEATADDERGLSWRWEAA